MQQRGDTHKQGWEELRGTRRTRRTTHTRHIIRWVDGLMDGIRHIDTGWMVDRNRLDIFKACVT